MARNVFSYGDLLTPVFLIAIYLIAYIIVQVKYKGTVLAKHFYWGLSLKLFGCFAFMALYIFYYGGGDTIRFYHNTLPLMDVLFKEPATFFEILTKIRIFNPGLTYPVLFENAEHYYRYDMYRSDTSFQIVRIAALFGFFTFKSYIGITLLFTFLSYIGVWSLYRTFTYLYPGYEKQLAIPILYFPSVFFWGSSLMKDTVVLGFVGLLTYCLYMLFFRKKKILLNILLILICFKVLKTTKEYVIIAYAPALIIWLFLSITNRMSKLVQSIVRPALLIIALGSIILLAPYVGKISEKYALESVLETAEGTANYIDRVNEVKGGAGYTLDVEYTPLGIMKALPMGISVTMYQPFLFQVKNPVMLLSALESTVVLFFTIYVLVRVGPIRFMNYIFSNPFLMAALVFSLFFAFAIGISTFNYGSLARYKLPCLPFYGVAFIVPLVKSLEATKRKRMLTSSSASTSFSTS